MMRVLSEECSPLGGGFDRFQLAQEIVGLDDVGVELDLERGVGRAYLGDAREFARHAPLSSSTGS